MDKLTVGLVSLGCDKNRVDAEVVLKKLSKEFKIVSDPKEADIIIVNTCGFIEAAKQESINTILEMSSYKEKSCKLLVVTGCLSARYGKELMELLPEVDIMLGVNNYEKLTEEINEYFRKKQRFCDTSYSDSNINEGERILTTPNYTAYLRIAEGCNNFCTYCIIPKIRGKYRSRSMESIINEAKELVKNGVKELIVVAQDTTKYGTDIYGDKMLPELLEELCKIEGVEWVRLMYCYPEEITDKLINTIAKEEKICNYIDIPLQHISNSVLKRMGRRSSKEQIRSIVKNLRDTVKDITIRTSIIVGFPGETEEEFEELKNFLCESKLNKVGVFKYSPEENTPAALMKDQIEDSIKQYREEELMILQQKISLELNQNKVGKVFKVLVEGFNDKMWYGRTYEMAPEIDGLMFFTSQNDLKEGQIINVKVTDCLEYDLIGVVCDESC